jgi:GNAT superfamily N-acetyltransferase
MDPNSIFNRFQFDITARHYGDKLSGLTVDARTTDGESAGWLNAPVANDEESGDFDIYVHPQYRRQGLGAQMWRMLENDRPNMNFAHGPFLSEEGQALAHKMVRENPRQHYLHEEHDYVDPELNW